jgi:glycosyltransferase involved in cell wall biosynthesis
MIKYMYSKMLIIGQPINSAGGGGITLRNLMFNWPKDKIAFVLPGLSVTNFDFSVSNHVYSLGKRETIHHFPLNLIKKKYQSGVVTPKDDKLEEIRKTSKSSNWIKAKLTNYSYEFLNKLGIIDLFTSYKISSELLQWCKDFSPDFIYFQAGSVSQIHFVRSLLAKLPVPLILHIMDDRMEAVYSKGLIYKLKWRNTLMAFNELSENAHLRMAISGAMSREYSRRYGALWEFFHNSIDTKNWVKEPIEKRRKSDSFKILYLGRIGLANSKVINKFAEMISLMKKFKMQNIELHLYVNNTHNLPGAFSKLTNVFVHDAVAHHKVIDLMRDHDLLLLPLDFEKYGERYAKFSMPTKMTEYMASGVPVFVLAPESCAVSAYAKEKTVAFVCNSLNHKDIMACLSQAIESDDKRNLIAQLAIQEVLMAHDIHQEQERFIKLLNK